MKFDFLILFREKHCFYLKKNTCFVLQWCIFSTIIVFILVSDIFLPLNRQFPRFGDTKSGTLYRDCQGLE